MEERDRSSDEYFFYKLILSLIKILFRGSDSGPSLRKKRRSRTRSKSRSPSTGRRFSLIKNFFDFLLLDFCLKKIFSGAINTLGDENRRIREKIEWIRKEKWNFKFNKHEKEKNEERMGENFRI